MLLRPGWSWRNSELLPTLRVHWPATRQGALPGKQCR
jgi:hypothetical protein